MATKKVKPLGDRVLVKRSVAHASKGGIILPEAAKEKPKQGEIIAAGPGKLEEDGTLTPLEVAVGDRILFGAYAGTEVKIDESDSEYLIMKEDDILAIIQ